MASMPAPGADPALDLARFSPVNTLWPSLVERLGLERSQRAVQQALDLQAMHGTEATLPLLLVETCGLALVNVELLRHQTGLVGAGERLVLLLSRRDLTVQLLQSA
jgi:hypothetical protein